MGLRIISSVQSRLWKEFIIKTFYGIVYGWNKIECVCKTKSKKKKTHLPIDLAGVLYISNVFCLFLRFGLYFFQQFRRVYFFSFKLIAISKYKKKI